MSYISLPPNFRRNFWCLVSDMAFFGMGMAFISPGTVIPGFLSRLGASAAIIGLISTLQSASWLLPQLFSARYMADKPLKKPYILWGAALGRISLLLLLLVIWLTGARPVWLIISLIALYTVWFWVGDGIASLPWFDLLSKVIPPRRRGRLTSVGQLVSGGISFAAGFFVEWMLGDRGPGYPNNYVGLFAIGFVLMVGSFIAVAGVKEERSAAAARVPTWREYLPQLWGVLKNDRVFRRLIIARQLSALGGLALPFYMPFAIRRLGLPDQVAGRYVSIGVVGGILAALLFGWMNEKYGSKWVILVGMALSLTVPATALLIPYLPLDPIWLAWGFGLVFFLSNAAMNSMMPGWLNYVMEWSSDAERGTYIGLTNTLNGVATIFSTLGGLILQWTNENYTLLFVVTIIGLLLPWPLVIGVPEPRKLHHQES